MKEQITLSQVLEAMKCGDTADLHNLVEGLETDALRDLYAKAEEDGSYFSAEELSAMSGFTLSVAMVAKNLEQLNYFDYRRSNLHHMYKVSTCTRRKPYHVIRCDEFGKPLEGAPVMTSAKRVTTYCIEKRN